MSRSQLWACRLPHHCHPCPSQTQEGSAGSNVPGRHLGTGGASPRAGLPPGCHRGSAYRSSGSVDCRRPSRATWEAAPKAPRRGASSINPHGALRWSGHDITLWGRGRSACPACWELGFQAWAQSTCPELSAQGLVPLRWGCALPSPNAPGKADL